MGTPTWFVGNKGKIKSKIKGKIKDKIRVKIKNKIRVKIKSKIKGSGQECPLHTKDGGIY